MLPSKLVWILLLAVALPSRTAASAATCTKTFGYAYELRLGSYIQLSDNDFTKNTTTAFSMSGWVKPYTRAVHWGMLLGSAFWSTDQYNWNSGLGVNFDRVVFLAGDSFNKANETLSYPIPYNMWTHVVGTFNYTEGGGTGRLYVNGVLVRNQTGLGSTDHFSQPFYIGRMSDGSADLKNERLTGQLDELAMWSTVLTADRVYEIYSKGPLTGSESNLMLAYSADRDNSTHAFDLSPNKLHGTYVQNVTGDLGSMAASMVVSFRPNCIWCRNTTEAAGSAVITEATCVPMVDNESVCGDGAVTGNEECESGTGCVGCQCESGYEPFNGRCKLEGTTCKYTNIAACMSAISTCSKCSCLTSTMAECISSAGCNGYEISYLSLKSMAKMCTSKCGSSFDCTQSLPDKCLLNTTKSSCTGSGCSWCGHYCVANKVDCRPLCGNSHVEAGEICDNGKVTAESGCNRCKNVVMGWKCIDGECSEICGDGIIVGSEECDTGKRGSGCNSSCLIAPGCTCTKMATTGGYYTSQCNCTSSDHEKTTLSGGAIAGIVIGAVAAGVILTVTSAFLFVIVSRKLKDGNYRQKL